MYEERSRSSVSSFLFLDPPPTAGGCLARGAACGWAGSRKKAGQRGKGEGGILKGRGKDPKP